MPKPVVGFGEIMVRLSPPGYLKLLQAPSFDVNYTGAEANVCVSLSRFGLPTQFVSRLPASSDMTEAALGRLRQYGVGLRHMAYGGERIGLYYLERGASQRPSKIIYDRKHSSLATAGPGDFDWDAVFEDASWFHFTGITAGLSQSAALLCADAVTAARRHRVPVSCDLNYRKALWPPDEAKRVMSGLVRGIDLLIGNEEDAETALGVSPQNTDVHGGRLDYGAYTDLARQISETFGIRSVAFTLRTSLSASDNRWAGLLYRDGASCLSKEYAVHMVDRVGGGDSFAAGLLFALLRGDAPQPAIEFAVAASCLKQTMEQDFNLASVQEVEALMGGDGSGRVQR